jgi:2-polyprenyl-6-hydroxyphenyl methylase/3-demethylubiquinone-9 3-methyltransferase
MSSVSNSNRDADAHGARAGVSAGAASAGAASAGAASAGAASAGAASAGAASAGAGGGAAASAASGYGTASGNSDSGELGKFDALASRFWDVRGEFRPLHLLNPVRARFVAERATLAGARVLDVGCGGGLLAEALARAGAKVTAIDLAPGMIEVARLHAMEQKLEIDYRMVAAEAVAAAEPGGFDVVTCMEMLEHVPDPAQMVATLAKLVRPGGAVFISTLNRNLKSFLLAIVGAEYVMKLIPRGTHEYDRLIRPAELARWARSAELSLRELAGIELNPFTEHCSLSRDIAVNYLAHLER